MRQVNQYSEQVRDMHRVMFKWYTRTSSVMLCSKRGVKNTSFFYTFQHLNKCLPATSKCIAVQKISPFCLSQILLRWSLPRYTTAQQSRQHTKSPYMPPHNQRTREARLTFYKGWREKEMVKRKEEWHKYTCSTGQRNQVEQGNISKRKEKAI